MALAGSMPQKTACLFSVEGLYDALDPLMSFCLYGREGRLRGSLRQGGAPGCDAPRTVLEAPILVSDGTARDLSSALSFAFDLSARYEMPCIVETLPPEGITRRKAAAADGASAFVKDTGRWAAIPKFGYRLHKALNAKIERIRDEFGDAPRERDERQRGARRADPPGLH